MKAQRAILSAVLAGFLGFMQAQNNSTQTSTTEKQSQEELEKLLSQGTAKTDWNDPVTAVAEGCVYLSYPTPSRGEGTTGSAMVYLPPNYDDSGSTRYPVIYYLHGGTGNQREARWMIRRIDRAIKAGEMNPVIVVSPQALPIGWYINANTSDPKVTSGPIEDVIIKDLIPYVDNNFRTIPTGEARGIEGFSMGGRGSLMLAFKHPDMFTATSSVAGAVVNWDEEPLQRALECTFGSINNPYSKIYFDAWHPQVFACQNARRIVANDMKVRLFVGDKDRLHHENGKHITDRFHHLLDTLGISHSYTIVPGANHNPSEIFTAGINDYDTSFWDNAFSEAVANQESAGNTPDEIKSFITANFPDSRIVKTVTENEPNGDHYTLTLSNNATVRFNEHFNWIKADCTDNKAAMPKSLIHEGIAKYLEAYYPDKKVDRIEKVPRTGYDVQLSDGTKLLFDTKGQLIDK